MRPFTGGGLLIGGPLYVMVPVMCNNCKYTWQFNAVAAGVLEAPAQAQPQTSDSDEPKSPE